jgi:hypothetical protein
MMLVACVAGTESLPSPSSSITPQPSVSLPPDGVTLEALGFTNGPVAEFSLPRTAVVVSKVDQPDNVAAVLSATSAAQVADYLRRSLPAGGFVISRDDRAETTLTFDGYGWTGSFTGTGGTSAVLLRPQ